MEWLARVSSSVIGDTVGNFLGACVAGHVLGQYVAAIQAR